MRRSRGERRHRLGCLGREKGAHGGRRSSGGGVRRRELASIGGSDLARPQRWLHGEGEGLQGKGGSGWGEFIVGGKRK